MSILLIISFKTIIKCELRCELRCECEYFITTPFDVRRYFLAKEGHQTNCYYWLYMCMIIVLWHPDLTYLYEKVARMIRCEFSSVIRGGIHLLTLRSFHNCNLYNGKKGLTSLLMIVKKMSDHTLKLSCRTFLRYQYHRDFPN